MRIVAPHFVAGLLIDERGVVYDAAPIIRYMVGWSKVRAVKYCKKKGWTIEYGSGDTIPDIR